MPNAVHVQNNFRNVLIISTLPLTKTSTIKIATKTSQFQRLPRRLARPIDSG